MPLMKTVIQVQGVSCLKLSRMPRWIQI